MTSVRNSWCERRDTRRVATINQSCRDPAQKPVHANNGGSKTVDVFRRVDARGRPIDPRFAQRDLPPSAVLALQRAAGNSAVVALVSGSTGRRSPALLPDHGRSGLDVVQHVQRWAIQVRTGAVPNRVERLDIGDRPPKGLFGSQDKSHTTAWASFCDGLRYEITGQTFARALVRVDRLYEFAKTLPGALRAGNLPDDGKAKRIYDAARANADAAKATATGALADDNARHAALQQYASAYLDYRNALPLSAVDLGKPATGAGEPAVLTLIREHEEDRARSSAAELRRALWKLLDPATVVAVRALGVTREVAPGLPADPGAAERRAAVVDLLRQHLASMGATYPRAFAKADLSSQASVDDFLRTSVALSGPTLSAISAAVRASALPTMHVAGRAAGTAAAAGEGFAVQIVLDAAGQVSDVAVGGRPPGVLGARPGSHTTPWVVMVASLRESVRGKTLALARDALVDLKRYRTNTANADGELAARLAAVPQPGRAVVQAAAAGWTAATAAAGGAAPSLAQVQQLAAAYLSWRNALPFAATLHGSPANARNEARKIKTITDAGADPGERRAAMWSLLDPIALEDIRSPANPSDAPGILTRSRPGEVLNRLAIPIRVHIREITTAYPTAAAAVNFTGVASVMQALRGFGVIKDDAVQAGVALGLDRAACVAAYPVGPVKGSRGLDDDSDYEDEPAPRGKRRKVGS